MSQRKASYVPSPAVNPQTLPRLALIVEVMAGQKSVSQAARELGLSRNHFQTILHRAESQLVDSLTLKPGGRPSRAAQQVRQQAELKHLRRQNAKLQKQVAATRELLEVAGGLLRGRLRPTTRGRRPRTNPGASHEPVSDSDPEAWHQQVLSGVQHMQRLGLTRREAAHLAGVDAATVRRWRARSCRARAIAPPCAARAEALVRALHGLVGASALAHEVLGLSRRQAAALKAEVLTRMEQERKAHLVRVRLSQPGILRGLDAMHFTTCEGVLYALIVADGAIPYRTMLVCGEHYDATLVAQTLREDIERHGAPLILRLDRARCHEAPEVRALLEQHGVLMLHGPSHYPRYYGQLERQNLEHRLWMQSVPRQSSANTRECLGQMIESVNALWPRRTLGWKSAQQIWKERQPILIDRAALREEVKARAERIARDQRTRGASADLAERLAIERTLERKGYLRLQPGGWC